MPFKPGQSGNPAGLARGTKHKSTAEIRALSSRLFDADYWKLKYARLHSGEENPKIEAILLAYAFGEPPKEIHASGTVIHLGPLEALRAIQSRQGETFDSVAIPETGKQTLTNSQTLTREETVDRAD